MLKLVVMSCSCHVDILKEIKMCPFSSFEAKQLIEYKIPLEDVIDEISAEVGI